MKTKKFKKLLAASRCTTNQFAKNIGYSPSKLKRAMKDNHIKGKLAKTIKSYEISFEPIELALMADQQAGGYLQPLRDENIYIVSDNKFIFYGEEINAKRAMKIVDDIIYNKLIIHKDYKNKSWIMPDSLGLVYDNIVAFEFVQCNKGQESLFTEYIANAVYGSSIAPEGAQALQLVVDQEYGGKLEVLSPDDSDMVIGEYMVEKYMKSQRELIEAVYDLNADDEATGLMVDKYFGKYDTIKGIHTRYLDLVTKSVDDDLSLMTALSCKRFNERIYYSKVEIDDLPSF